MPSQRHCLGPVPAEDDYPTTRRRQGRRLASPDHIDAGVLSAADFTHVEDTRVRRLLDFWLEARDGELMPPVSAIDPVKFAFALSNIWLCDVVADDPRGRWRYRVVGDEVRLAHGGNIVGKTVESITDASARPRVVKYFAIATDWPAVVHVGGRLYAESTHPARGERIILPFRDEATGRVGRLLGATFHSWLERGFPVGCVPSAQTRTYTPVDGTPATTERSEA